MAEEILTQVLTVSRKGNPETKGKLVYKPMPTGALGEAGYVPEAGSREIEKWENVRREFIGPVREQVHRLRFRTECPGCRR